MTHDMGCLQNANCDGWKSDYIFDDGDGWKSDYIFEVGSSKYGKL